MNPFRYGQIVSKRDFCSRPQLLTQLTEFALAGQNVFIQGERRTGKTSLIHEVVRKLKGYRLIYVDLLEIKSVDDLSRRMLTALVRLENKASFQAKIISSLAHFRPALTIDPISGLPSISFDLRSEMKPDSLEGILDLIGGQGAKRKIVVAFDEFQDVLNLKESKTALALLRSRIQFQNSIPYFFSGSVRNSMNGIFTDPSSPFFKSAASLEVGSINERSFIPFLKRRFASGERKISKSFLETAMRMSGSIPGDVQELCACLWDASDPGETLARNHLDRALGIIYSRERKANEAAMMSMTGHQLRCVAALARNGSVKVLSKEFMDATGIRTASSVQAALKRLIKLKIIYRHKGAYSLANPFFGSWLLWKGY